MIIKKIMITSFGKFSDKHIDFSDGFNVIQGENEAGKSTIHKFIEGMFFGFIETGKSRRSYTKDFDKYKPRNKNSYCGSMIIVNEGVEYLIERNFSKRNPSVKVFDNVTGEDITSTLEVNKTTKLPDIANFFELDYTLYRNTISISQMLNQTSSDLSSVLVEKLTNMHSTKDEFISIKSINDNLDKRINEIGSKNAKTKPFYKTKEKVLSLGNELETSKEEYKRINEYSILITELENEISKIESNIQELDKTKFLYDNQVLKQKFNKALEIQEELNECNKELISLEKYKMINELEYDLAKELNSKIEQKKIKIKELKEEINSAIEKMNTEKSILDKLTYFEKTNLKYTSILKDFSDYKYLRNQLETNNQELSDLKDINLDDNLNNGSLKIDYEIFLRYDKEIKQLKNNNQDQYELDNLKRQLQYLENSLPSKYLKIIYFLLCFIIVGFFLLVNHNRKIKRIKNDIESIQNQIIIYEDKLKINRNNLSEKEEYLNTLFTKYNCRDEIDFNLLYQENSSNARNNEAKLKRYNQLVKIIQEDKHKYKLLSEKLGEIFFGILGIKEINSINLQAIERKYDTFSESRSNFLRLTEFIDLKRKEFDVNLNDSELLYEEYKKCLANNGVDNLDEFKQSVISYRKYKEVSSKHLAIKQRFNDLMGKDNIDSLKEKIDFDINESIDEEVLKDIQVKKDNYNDVLISKLKEIAKYKENILHIENNNREISIIDSELLNESDKLLSLENSNKALNIVKDILNELSDEIKYEFAPTLNKEISSVIETITNNKYNDIKLDRTVDVKMFDTTTNTFESINSYSTGTIDQIYLSMRFGIIKTVTDKVFPFILDDCFVNYDYNRLKNVLDIINIDIEQSDRQVIMFTCHQRELEILTNANHNFSLINV